MGTSRASRVIHSSFLHRDTLDEDQHDEEDDGLLFGILQLVVPLLVFASGRDTLNENQHDEEDGVDGDGE